MTERIEILTMREACDYLRVSRWTLRDMTLRGDLHPVRMTNGRKGKRYRLSDLNRFIERRSLAVRR